MTPNINKMLEGSNLRRLTGWKLTPKGVVLEGCLGDIDIDDVTSPNAYDSHWGELFDQAAYQMVRTGLPHLDIKQASELLDSIVKWDGETEECHQEISDELESWLFLWRRPNGWQCIQRLGQIKNKELRAAVKESKQPVDGMSWTNPFWGNERCEAVRIGKRIGVCAYGKLQWTFADSLEEGIGWVLLKQVLPVHWTVSVVTLPGTVPRRTLENPDSKRAL